MRKKISPALAVLAAILALIVAGLLGLRLFGDTGGSQTYTAGVKPPDLEQHVNRPSNIQAAGGGSPTPPPARSGAGN